MSKKKQPIFEVSLKNTIDSLEGFIQEVIKHHEASYIYFDKYPFGKRKIPVICISTSIENPDLIRREIYLSDINNGLLIILPYEIFDESNYNMKDYDRELMIYFAIFHEVGHIIKFNMSGDFDARSEMSHEVYADAYAFTKMDCTKEEVILIYEMFKKLIDNDNNPDGLPIEDHQLWQYVAKALTNARRSIILDSYK